MSFLGAVLRFRATIQGRVHRTKGSRFRDPATGRLVTVPGGEWHNGVEGRWYDHGTLTDRAVLVSAWKWLWARIRMEVGEIAKFLAVLLRRKR